MCRDTFERFERKVGWGRTYRMLTATWQLVTFPKAPQYWWPTPTDPLPCLRSSVSSKEGIPFGLANLGTTPG